MDTATINRPAHIFEQSGLGRAPFRVVGFFSYPSPSMAASNPRAYMDACHEAANTAKTHGVRGGACEHCGMALMNNYILASADHRRFVVGCDCVRKTGDLGVIAAVERAERARRNLQSKARKTAKLNAAKVAARVAGKVSRIALLAAHSDLFRAAWAHRADKFVRSVLRQGLAKGKLSDAQIAALQRWLDKGAEVAAKRAADAARLAKAHHIGKVGERLRGIKVRCVARIVGGDPFAPWCLKILHTVDGCALVTFGTCRLNVDDEAVIDCTVKEHRNNKRTDEPETAILRLKVHA